ncbi:MAG: SMP-30/gluconolactonase/LRE family protein, partial [Pseudoxanthomonas sp.]
MSGQIATLAVESRCALGEGILWCDRRRILLWTDIDACQLWQHDPASSHTQHWDLPDPLGCLALAEDGRLLLALAKGLYIADLPAATQSLLPLQHLLDVEPGISDTRSNDGRADRHGNFVFGTKGESRDSGAPMGGYYQYSARHGLRALGLPAAAIPNSICFSLDGSLMYYCDSRHPRLMCCDYDAARARISNPRVFAEVDDQDASPDGSIIDASGLLWNAQWGASRVVRYQADGQVDRIIRVPASQPSCCCFGGDNFDLLYITTARS